jgi:outer membrane lipoprotein-sorting protein
MTLRTVASLARRATPILAALSLAACARSAKTTTAPAAAHIASGEDLLRAMRDRYTGKWYHTLTFRQTTTQVVPSTGAERKSTWYETLMLPGRLRIDTDLEKGSGQLYANDSQYVVLNNALRRSAAGHNPLLVLGFDVYGQPPARTASILADLGFPNGPVREGTWMERPVWIVGGAPNDLHSSQYWVDKERLVFVRLLQPFPGDPSQTYDVRFSDYRPAGSGWVAARVEAFVGSKRTLLEEYDDIKVNPTVSEALFDPRKWNAAPHWAKESK